jgi:putative hydrolase of the HAD superfamily
MLRYLLLDLDNTLYSESHGLEKAVFVRMMRYAADFLGLSVEETMERRRAINSYGTTLEWLIRDHGYSDIEAYFAAVHPAGEEEPLSPDPALGRLLDSMDLPKAIFTNAPREHAERILARLGVADRFEEIYDVRFNQFQGKPHVEAARRVCAACGVEPKEALFVDDLPRYVEGFIAAGGRGILFDELDRHGHEGMRRIHSLVELPAILAEDELDRVQPGLFD